MERNYLFAMLLRLFALLLSSISRGHMQRTSLFLILIWTLAVPVFFAQTTDAEFYDRGSARLVKGNLDGAVADYSKAIELNPKHTEAYYNRGRAYSVKGDFAAAIADYSKVIELDAKHAGAYYNRGSGRFVKQDLDGAMADYTKAVELDPKHADAYHNRGYARYLKGDLDGAIADLTKAIELDPTKASAYTRRGFSYYRKKQYALAVADFNKSISLDPNYEETYFGRASTRWSLNDLGGAIEDYTKYIDLNPKKEGFPADAYCSLGSVKSQQGNDLGAIADFSSAINFGHPYAHVYRARGIARAGRDILEGAVADFTEAIRLEPQDASNYKQRAAILRRLGRTALALADDVKAAELNNALAVKGRTATVSESVEGTTWEWTTGDLGFTYKFKKNGVVIETMDDLEKKETIEGTYVQDGTLIRMKFTLPMARSNSWQSDHTIEAKITGERNGGYMEGTLFFKDDNTKRSWSAFRK